METSVTDSCELPSEKDAVVAGAARRIQSRQQNVVQDIIALGTDLILVKAALGHGQWGAWLETEVSMSQSTATNFMRVAREFGSKLATVSNVPPKALYILAAPSTPAEARERMLRRAEAGRKVSFVQAKAAIRKVKRERGAVDYGA